MYNHLCNVDLIISVYLTGTVSLLATPGKYCYVDLRFMLIALETIVNIIFMCVAQKFSYVLKNWTCFFIDGSVLFPTTKLVYQKFLGVVQGKNTEVNSVSPNYSSVEVWQHKLKKKYSLEIPNVSINYPILLPYYLIYPPFLSSFESLTCSLFKVVDKVNLKSYASWSPGVERL
jgi:hypothetical protein